MGERHDKGKQLTTADVAAAERRDRGMEAHGEGGETARTTAAGTLVEETETGTAAPLFSGDEGGRFRHRWNEIQTGFVDEPRQAVEQADGLVAEVMQRLVQIFADERKGLEAQWGRGGNISTEDLRQALRRYRVFFDRLLSV